MNDIASSGAGLQHGLLETVSDALGLAVFVCDRNDEILFASRPIQQFYPVDERFLARGTRLRDFLGAVFDLGFRSATANESSRRRVNRDEWISERVSLHWRERYETVERIARQRWISIRKRRLANGLCVVLMVEVSEQKKKEEQLRLDLERVEMTEGILDGLPNPVCVKDRSLTYVAVNKAFCTLHGMTADQILGRSVWDLIEPNLAEKFEKSDRMVLETGREYSLPEQLVKANGDDCWVVTHKFRVGDQHRGLIVTCMNDVTDVVVGFDRDSITPELAERLAVRDYAAFEPAQNCHDPYQALDLHMLAQTALSGGAAPEAGLPGSGDEPDMAGRLTRMAASAARATATAGKTAARDPAEDAKTLMATGSGPAPAAPGAAHRPPPVAHGRIVLVTAHAHLEQRWLTLLAGAGYEACALRTDAELAAFLAAIDAAGLSVDALLRDPDAKGGEPSPASPALACVALSRDRTDGEILAALERVLDQRRAGASPIRTAGAAAEPLPVQPLPLQPLAIEPLGALQGPADWEIVLPVAEPPSFDIDVLVAEDNEINQFVFSQILEGLGLSYKIAANGEEAVRFWKRLTPRLIFMDVAMPVMNGFDATRAIRAAEAGLVSRTPIIAVTAQAHDIDLEQARAAGMDDHIVKPISPDMIERVYVNHTRERPEQRRLS